MNNKILFFGEKNCEFSEKASSYLTELAYDVQSVFCEGRRSQLSDELLEWSGDYIFSYRSYYIFKESFLARAKVAALNFHPAPPEHPGSGAINWALYNGDAEYGVTAHIMNGRVDNGPILKVIRFPVGPDDRVETLLQKTKQASLDLFMQFAANIKTEGAAYLQRKLNESQYITWEGNARKMSEVDVLQRIDINCSKAELDRVVRSTRFGKYGPEINLHGYVFVLKEVEQ